MRRDSAQSIFDAAKHSRVWIRLNPDEVAEALDAPRKRIVRALEVLEERQLIHLTASDVRQRYTHVRGHEGALALTDELALRFERREASEIARMKQVLDLIEHDGCQTNVLTSYFGEEREEPCGHCSWCRTGRVSQLPPPREFPPLPDKLNVDEWRELCAANPDSLALPRQRARFLCGLSSPALTRAKLPRHPFFGIFIERPFAEVLEWVS